MNESPQTSVIINYDVIEKLKEFNKRDEVESCLEHIAFLDGVKCYADQASIGMMIYLSEKEES